MAKRALSYKSGLYAAAAWGALVSALFLFSAVQDRDDFNWPWVVTVSVSLLFFLGLGLVGRWLSHRSRRRWWMTGCAFVSFAIAVMGGGPGGFIAFGPSIAILAWLAARG
jgi:hypothetical protein